MVAYRQVDPVVLQRILGAPKHRPDVGSVLLRGVEVRIIPDVDRQPKRYVGPGVKHPVAEGRGVAQLGRVGPEERLQAAPDGRPGRWAEGHEVVQRGLREGAFVLQLGDVKDAFVVEGGEVEHLVPDGHPHPGHGRLGGREHAVRKVLDGKWMVGCHLKKGGEGRSGGGVGHSTRALSWERGDGRGA